MKKRCTKCGEEKALEMFHRKTGATDGRKSRCAVCQNAASATWHATNREKHLALNRAWYEKNHAAALARTAKWRTENAERHLAYLAAWREKNADRVRESSRNRLRRWKKDNRGAVNADKMRRIANQLQATPEWADRAAIRAIYKDAAHLRKMGVDCEVDHIVPLRGKTVSGLHVHANMQIVSGAYNRQKGNLTWPHQP